jgi:hypothetical protein
VLIARSAQVEETSDLGTHPGDTGTGGRRCYGFACSVGDGRNLSGSDVGNMILMFSEAPGVLASSFAVSFGSPAQADLSAASRFFAAVT